MNEQTTQPVISQQHRRLNCCLVQYVLVGTYFTYIHILFLWFAAEIVSFRGYITLRPSPSALTLHNYMYLLDLLSVIWRVRQMRMLYCVPYTSVLVSSFCHFPSDPGLVSCHSAWCGKFNIDTLQANPSAGSVGVEWTMSLWADREKTPSISDSITFTSFCV